ncbi:MAG: GNAT family N-acetyltransferase [Chloroflexota bacterium]|nr:GNAT family N-acetyltransferase [Chloroflexota bacterium]
MPSHHPLRAYQPPATVYELPHYLIDRAASLFAGAWFDEAQIHSVFEGKQAGRVFVDDPDTPTAALLCRTYGYYLADSTTTTTLRAFLRDEPAEVGIFHALYGYMVDGAWRDALLAEQPHRWRIIDRKAFILPPGTPAPRVVPPTGTEIRRLDRVLAERADGELHAGIGMFWGSYERFIAGGFGFCSMVHGAMASVAYAISVSSHSANIAVNTSPSHRRRGFSTLTSSAYIDHCLAHGIRPTWDTDRENEPSIRTALRLGLVEDRPFYQLSPKDKPKNALSHGRWRQGNPHPTAPPGLIPWRKV